MSISELGLAESCFRWLTDEFPEDGGYWLGLAQSLRYLIGWDRESDPEREARFAEIERAVRRAESLGHAGVAGAWVDVACCYDEGTFDDGDARGFRLLRHALELDPRNADAWHLMARHHLKQGHPNDAAAAARRCIEIDPSIEEGHCRLGQALEMLGDLEGALAAEEAALRADSDHSEACDRLAELRRRLGRIDE